MHVYTRIRDSEVIYVLRNQMLQCDRRVLLLNAPHDPIATQLTLGTASGVAELYTTLQPCSALHFLEVVPQLRGFTPPVAILTEFAHCCSLCVEYMYM